jgi:hypothetical protein
VVRLEKARGGNGEEIRGQSTPAASPAVSLARGVAEAGEDNGCSDEILAFRAGRLHPYCTR